MTLDKLKSGEIGIIKSIGGEGALRRRQLRLVLGGKMKAEDADELRALFTKV